MSLVDYLAAVPWAESIREALIAQKMPPWYADPMGPAVKGGHSLPTRELDILLSWVVGGTPRGDEKTFIFGDVQGVTSPTYEGPANDWTAGAPDIKVQMTAEHTLPAGKIEDDATVTLATGVKEDTWVRAVDLLPGERSMLREAIIALENGPVLAAWAPGEPAIAAPNGTAFKLPAGARLTLKLHYKKNWNDEQNVKSDRMHDRALHDRGAAVGPIDRGVFDCRRRGQWRRRAEVLGHAEVRRADRRAPSELRSALRIGWHRCGRPVRPPRQPAPPPRGAAAVVPPLLAAGINRNPRGLEARSDRGPGATRQSSGSRRPSDIHWPSTSIT